MIRSAFAPWRAVWHGLRGLALRRGAALLGTASVRLAFAAWDEPLGTASSAAKRVSGRAGRFSRWVVNTRPPDRDRTRGADGDTGAHAKQLTPRRTV
jgi:hypothetical protein